MKKISQSFNLEDFFAPTGAIGRVLDSYERREQQVDMAKAVQGVLRSKRHLVVEAGTGVGKSFAYLVSAIERACSGGGNLGGPRAGRVAVSTFTITLQEQLIHKDIPCLKKCLPWGFKAVLAKGRSNYLCRRRLEFAVRRQMGLFDQFGSELSRVNDWANNTQDGTLSDMDSLPEGRVWDAVKSEHGNCRGRRCRHYAKCFYWQARRELENADLIVTNHALLFSDLALRGEGASILPDYECVIIDEAHNMERVAEEHFGIDISEGAVKFLLDGLYNPRTHKGLLVYIKAGELTDLVIEAGKAAKIFFRKVREWYEQNKGQTNGRCYVNFVDDEVSVHIKKLRSELGRLAKEAKDEDERFELMRYVDRCTALVGDLEAFLLQAKDDYVYWVEVNEGRRQAVTLRSAAINVGEDVRRCLFDKFVSVVMTSATLSSGSTSSPRAGGEKSKSGFEFFAGRVGLQNYDAVKLGSPFDYERQVTIYIEKDLPQPNDDKFIDLASETIKKYILQTQGRAFVLFTSYQMLGGFAERLADWLGENKIELLQQGAGLDRTALLKRFKRDKRSVLFGTDSFWQGVDVAGEALSNVVIVRLPFAVPDTPLLAGRLDRIREEGGNAFLDYQLPLAIIKFKQGFGRLIRTKTDTGIVVILDSRIISKSYGEKFLEAIPKCRTEIVTR